MSGAPKQTPGTSQASTEGQSSVSDPSKATTTAKSPTKMSAQQSERPSTSAEASGGGNSSFLQTIEERNKKNQRENLLEKLRGKNRIKPKDFGAIAKTVRTYFAEKQYPMEQSCKATLQQTLDTLQKHIKVRSRHGLVERLGSLSRQLGLKFVEDASTLFISTDMFYVEILFDISGKLSDVKVHHECKIEQQSCKEFVDCLNRGDFDDFTVQLEGLSSIYQLNAEPKVKNKAFVALQAMETDIQNLYETQTLNGNNYEKMSQSVVGLVLPRRGGHPMKLTFFCQPRHIIDKKSDANTVKYTIEEIIQSPRSISATVNLEGSSANKLQIASTVSFTKDPQTGADMAVYAPLTSSNSMLMPACYMLRFNTPIIVNYDALRNLDLPQTGTGDGPSTSAAASEAAQTPAMVGSIMTLIVQNASKNAINTCRKGLYVHFGDESHCYFFTENRKLQGTQISSLPFTEPAQLPKIIAFLKRQSIYYTLLASCVRNDQKHISDMERTTILEVTAVSFNQITVELQHPYEGSLATVDFMLTDTDDTVTCIIYSLYHDYTELSKLLTRTVRNVYSIPLVVYKLMACWNQEQMQKIHGTISTAGGASGGNTSSTSSSSTTGSGGGGPSGSSGFANFSMDLGGSGSLTPGDLGTGDLISIESIKIEAEARSFTESFAASASAANAFANIINLKRETGPDAQATSTISIASIAAAALAAADKASAAAAAAAAEMAAAAGGSVEPIVNPQQAQQPQPPPPPPPPMPQPHAQVPSGSKTSEVDLADKYKNIWKDKTSTLKHCVSITPISGDLSFLPSTSQQAQQQLQQQQAASLDVTRTGGIEIIPLSTQLPQPGVSGMVAQPIVPVTTASGVLPTATTSSSSTITITPITGGTGGSKDSKEKKTSGSSTPPSSALAALPVGPTKRPHDSSGSSSSSTSSTSTVVSSESQKEKKRKKKRDDSPMGPPEKVYSRQNSPAGTSDAGTTAVVRKFSSPSSSPKGSSSSGSLISSGAPGSSHSARPSPKHSPVYSSPKHTTASNSPKSPFGTHSPKHGSSGKPSMSTLKSATAATSLSPKGEKSGGGIVGASSSTSSLVRAFASSSSNVGAGMQAAAGSASSSLKTSRDKDKSSSLTCGGSGGPPQAISVAMSGAGAAAAMSSGTAGSSSLKSTLTAQQQQQQQQHQQQQQQQQQQLKPAVGLAHISTGGSGSSMTGFAGSHSGGTSAGAANAAALDINAALRKSMAGGAVSPFSF